MYLFIVMEEVLSRLLQKNFVDGRISCFSHPVGAPLVSHFLSADDLLVFANGERRSVRRFVQTLEVYEKWFSLLIKTSQCFSFRSILQYQGARV